MFLLKERLRQKYRTLNWPRVEPRLSPRYRGKPALADIECGQCKACYAACPTDALMPRPEFPARSPVLDMGRCIFCGACESVCPHGAFAFSGDYRQASFTRQGLVIMPGSSANESRAHMPEKLSRKRAMFRKSLKLRQVCAGGCNACEADCNVLGTPVYDLGRFGVEFTASPRHADGLVLTGPITAGMLPALMDAWQAMPSPRLLFVTGACAISGGIFRPSEQCSGGMDGMGSEAALKELAADVYIPGCPPNPWTILDGLLSI